MRQDTSWVCVVFAPTNLWGMEKGINEKYFKILVFPDLRFAGLNIFPALFSIGSEKIFFEETIHT